MKKIIALCLFLSIIFFLTACDLQNLFHKQDIPDLPYTEDTTDASQVHTDPDTTEQVTDAEVTEVTEDTTEETVTEPEVTEDITNPKETEKPTEPKETQKPTEPKVTEKPTEPKPTQKPTEPTVTEKPTQKPTEKPTAAPTEPPATEPPATEPPAPVLPDYYPGDMAQQILRLLNEERSKAGLGALSLSNTLSRISYVRATEISSTWSHTRPDGSSWSTVFDQYGVSWGGGIAENLAYISYSDAADVVTSWMNSSGHKANILNGSYSEIGVGIYYGGGNYYICTLFRA